MKPVKRENPYNCPLTNAIHKIGGRWKPLILYNLANGSRRFGQIGSLVPMISKKVLTEQLKELEADSIIVRKQSQEKPIIVEYSLTEKGLSVLPLLESFCEWGRSNF